MVGNKLLILDPRLSKIIESRKLDMIGLSSVSGIARNTEYLYVCGSDNRLHVIVADEYWQRTSVTADNDSQVTSVIADDEFALRQFKVAFQREFNVEQNRTGDFFKNQIIKLPDNDKKEAYTKLFLVDDAVAFSRLIALEDED